MDGRRILLNGGDDEMNKKMQLVYEYEVTEEGKDLNVNIPLDNATEVIVFGKLLKNISDSTESGIYIIFNKKGIGIPNSILPTVPDSKNPLYFMTRFKNIGGFIDYDFIGKTISGNNYTANNSNKPYIMPKIEDEYFTSIDFRCGGLYVLKSGKFEVWAR